MKLLTMFLFALPLLSQEVVTWNEGMGHLYENGRPWVTLSSGLISVSVSTVESGAYLETALVVSNRSNQALDVVPTTFSFVVLDPKKPPKRLDYVPPERIIGKINSSLAWSRLGTSMAAASATRQETTTTNSSGSVYVNGGGGSATGTYDGTSVSTRQVPDEQRRQQIWEAQRQREQQARDAAQQVAASALRANTVQPGQELKGVAYFKRDGSCGRRRDCALRLRIPIGNTTFEIPYDHKKR